MVANFAILFVEFSVFEKKSFKFESSEVKATRVNAILFSNFEFYLTENFLIFLRLYLFNILESLIYKLHYLAHSFLTLHLANKAN